MKAVPTTALALRLADLFKRRPNTAWADKEIRQFRVLVKQGCFENLDDLALIEQYYAFERKKGEKGCHRRDLYTLLNNFAGELDRATLWREAHPIVKPPRKVIPMPPAPSEPFAAPTDPQEIATLQRFETERQARKQR